MDHNLAGEAVDRAANIALQRRRLPIGHCKILRLRGARRFKCAQRPAKVIPKS